MKCVKRQKDLTLKDEPPGQKVSSMLLGRSRGQLPIAPKRMNGGPERKRCSAVGVSGDESKVRCCEEQNHRGNWNIRSMNQGTLDVAEQEMARVNTDTLEISEIKWTGMGEFNSDDRYIYCCGLESLRRNRIALKSQQTSPKYSTWVQP